MGKELVLEFEDGSKRTIQQNQVTSYAKMPNEQYVEVYDKVLSDGEILLNGEKPYFVSLQTEGQYLLMGETVSAQFTVGEKVCLEAKISDVNTPITLVKAHIENITIQNGRKKEQIAWPVITYQDLVQSNIAVSSTVISQSKTSLYLHGAEYHILFALILPRSLSVPL